MTVGPYKSLPWYWLGAALLSASVAHFVQFKVDTRYWG